MDHIEEFQPAEEGVAQECNPVTLEKISQVPQNMKGVLL